MSNKQTSKQVKDFTISQTGVNPWDFSVEAIYSTPVQTVNPKAKPYHPSFANL